MIDEPSGPLIIKDTYFPGDDPPEALPGTLGMDLIEVRENMKWELSLGILTSL